MSIQDSYDRWSRIYDSNKNKTRDLDAFVIRKVLEPFAFDTILELGCGTGKNTQWLSQKAEELCGIDISSGMLEVARKKIPDEHVRFIQSDIKGDWPVVDGYAGLITFNLVLEHIEALDPVFSQAYAKLKAGGKLFICELHPFKQYAGSKARFDTEAGRVELEVYVHHISEYVNGAVNNGFRLLGMNEWFDEDGEYEMPRLVSFLFERD